MLKCDKGNVTICGTAIDLLAEFSCLSHNMFTQFSEAIGSEDDAKKALRSSLEAGMKTEKELFSEAEGESKVDLLRTKDALDRLLEMMEEKLKGEDADGRDED